MAKDTKKSKKKEQFVPNFKKKVPTWKAIETEVSDIVSKYEAIDSSQIKAFNDLPLCKRTMKGLEKSRYREPTEIQRESIGIALRGADLLGAAKTGSGKTLAFLIPVTTFSVIH
jgi:ATP-dependent RNA helicase DDX10/DBP4